MVNGGRKEGRKVDLGIYVWGGGGAWGLEVDVSVYESVLLMMRIRRCGLLV